MKKIALFLVLALLVAVPAFAIQSKAGNDRSDEIWSWVKVGDEETVVVNKGTILIWDFTSSEGTDDSSYQVRVASDIAKDYIVAGVAQNTIATGDAGMVLLRGKGKIKTLGSVTSGDRLWCSNEDGRATGDISVDVANAASHDHAIAIALQTSATDATADAYICVI